MANKKGKGAGGKGGGGKGNALNNSKKPKQELPREPQLTPQERADAARPLWEKLSQQERVALLTIGLDELRQRAKQTDAAVLQQQAELGEEGEYLVMEPALEETLEEGILRMRDKGTWKVWTWPAGSGAEQHAFYDSEAFRSFIMEHHIREELRRLVPRDDPKAPEKPAEAAFRQRMTELLTKVQPNARLGLEEATIPQGRPHRRRAGLYDTSHAARSANLEALNTLLDALSKEHECLYQSLVQPVAHYCCDMLPAGMHKSSRTELALEDLERLHPEQAGAVLEWLIEKVDGLSTKLKVDPKKEEEPEDEENMGDVDLWSLTEEGKSLSVNDLWLQHLQERLLGEDGNPRKSKAGEDPQRNGLVLEWVYGSIVSTAEKARDAAKRQLGTYVASATDSLGMLLKALEDYYIWETRGKQAKELMGDMLKSRLEAQQLAEKFGIQPVPRNAQPDELPGDPGEQALPSYAIVSMLRREVLLTKAKLHFLVFEHLQQEKAVRMLKVQLRQGEPEFERLKRELDEVKLAHQRSLDGVFRSTAEMDRHRAQLADAAIEEQLEVQTAFREQGVRLQGIYDKKQRAELDMSKRESEIKQLQAWKGTVESLLDKMCDVLTALGSPISPPASESNAADGSTAGSKSAVTGGTVEEVATVEGDDKAAEGPSSSKEAAEHVGETPSPPAGAAGSSKGEAEGEGLAALEVLAASREGPEEGAAAAEHGQPEAGTDAALLTAEAAEASPHLFMQLAKLRNHFLRDVRKQLYGEAEDKQFFESFKQETKVVEKRLEESRVALQHLEMALINTACDDAGVAVGGQLALPLLQERLDAKALEYAAERAKEAESEIIKMELEQQAREAAERERKLKAKQSKKDKARCEKEKAAAQAAAERAAEEARRAAEDARRRQEEEEERRQRLEQLEALRKAEEEYMEQRRRELLSDESGYWRRRMDAEARMGGVAAAAQDADDEAEEEEVGGSEGSPSPSGVADTDPARDHDAGFVAYARPCKTRNQSKDRNSEVAGGSRHRDVARGAAQGPAAARGRRDQRDSSAGPQARGTAAATGQPAQQQQQQLQSPYKGAPYAPCIAPAPASAATQQPSLDADTSCGAAQTQAHSFPQPPLAAKAGNATPPAPTAATPVAASGPAAASAGAEVPHTQLPPTTSPSAAPAGPPQAPPPPQPQVSTPGQEQQQVQLGPHPASSVAPVHPPTAAPVPIIIHVPTPYGADPYSAAPHLSPSPHGPPAAVAMRPAMHGTMPLSPHGAAVPMPMPMPMPAPYLPHHPHSHSMPPNPHMLGAGPAAMYPHPGMVPSPNNAMPHPMFLYPQPHMHMPHPQGGMIHHGMMPVRMQGAVPHYGGPQMPIMMPMGAPMPMQQQVPPQPLPPQAMAGATPPSPSTPEPAKRSPKVLSIGAKPFIPFAMRAVSASVESGGSSAATTAAGTSPHAGEAAPAAATSPAIAIPSAALGKAADRQFTAVAESPLTHLDAADADASDHSSTSDERPCDGADGGLPNSPRHAWEQVGNSGRNSQSSTASGRPGSRTSSGADAELLQEEMSSDASSSGGEDVRLSGSSTASTARSAGDALPHHQQQQQQQKQQAGEAALGDSAAAARKPTTWSAIAAREASEHPPAAASTSSSAQTSSAMAGSWKQKLQHGSPAQVQQGQQQQQQQQQQGSWGSRPGQWTPGAALNAVKTPPPLASPAQRSETPGSTPSQRRVAPGAGPGPASSRPGSGPASASGGGSRTNAALMAEPARPLPGSLRPTPDGAFVFVPAPTAAAKAAPAQQQPAQTDEAPSSTSAAPSTPSRRAAALGAGPWEAEKRLALVRPLLNRGSQNNCFLNVIVQSLWHLPCFREPFLKLGRHGAERPDAAEADRKVVGALWSIFQAMAGAAQQAAADGCAAASHQGGSAGVSVISPQPLRDALVGQPSLHVAPTDMHDAGEVLTDLLTVLHRAELGHAAGDPAAAGDMQLPARVKLPPRGQQQGRQQGRDADTRIGDAPRAEPAAGAAQDADAAQPVVEGCKSRQAARTLAQRVFGLDIQVPCAAESGDAKAASSSAPAANASTAVEVQQFTKFFHLVPAQALRRAGAALPLASFEQLLCEVEGPPSAAADAGSQAQKRATLLRLPAVFTLAVVWESPQAPTEAIRGTIEALSSQVQLSKVFSVQGGASAIYELRSIVCYFGHHYLAYVFSEELSLWLMVDDEEVVLAGRWADVCRAIVSRRLQPSLLFYATARPQSQETA